MMRREAKMLRRFRLEATPNRTALALAFAACVLLPGWSAANDHDAGHAHHHPRQSDVMRSAGGYVLPDVRLVRDDGLPVSLPAEFDDGKPVFLAFIYTSCTTVCPLTSQTLASLQQGLGRDSRKVHLASVSIDPEEDTPARLRAYAQRFGAGPAWRHYTGTTASSVAVQRAFDAYRGDKMNHNPVIFFRPAPGQAWIRFDGFVSGQDLLSEYASFARGG